MYFNAGDFNYFMCVRLGGRACYAGPILTGGKAELSAMYHGWMDVQGSACETEPGDAAASV